MPPDKVVSRQKQQEAVPKESKDDPTVHITEPIWSYSELRRSKIYAALLFFDSIKPVQSTAHITDSNGIAIEPAEENTTNKLLDQVALLLARFKKTSLTRPGPVRSDEYASSAVQNVTATAIQIQGNQISEKGPKNCIIHIRKNGGSHDFDDWRDVAFAEQLESWYNRLTLDPGSQSLPDKGNKIWKLMLTFWARRICFYFDKLWEFRTKWVIRFEHIKESFRSILLESHGKCAGYTEHDQGSCEKCTLSREHINADFEHAWKLLGAMSRGDRYSDDVDNYAQHIWFEDSSGWKSRIRKAKAKPDEDNLAEKFRKVIKWFRLLKTPQSVLKRLFYL